jgi:hypothetical protein
MGLAQSQLGAIEGFERDAAILRAGRTEVVDEFEISCTVCGLLGDSQSPSSLLAASPAGCFACMNSDFLRQESGDL